MSEIIPLRLGARVVFADRWAGRVTGFEISESWEVLNLLVTNGLWRSNTVKLPFDTATWTADHVTFPAATSIQAFAREVPPVAAPALPLSGNTPLSIPGARVAGALICARTQQTTELLLTRGGVAYRVPVDQATFSGKELLVTTRADALERFYGNGQIEEAVREAIRRSRALPVDETMAVGVSVSDGSVHITGNVRTKQSLAVIRGAVSDVPGVNGASIEAADDATLEFDVAQALYRSGVARGAEIHPRSALGIVTLFGFTATSEAAAEAVRVASRVPGVRSVNNLTETTSRQPVPA